MNNYLQHQHRETKMKFDKFSSRLQKSQESGKFHKMTRSKQNFLLQRLKRIWEKLRILEVRLKITSLGAALACIMMVTNLGAQDQFVSAQDQNPLSPPSVFAIRPMLMDIDSDGDLDLLASENYIGLDLFINVGIPTAPKFEKIADEDDPFAGVVGLQDLSIGDIIASGDLDGDGDIDILTRSASILYNIGSNASPEFKEEAFGERLPYNCSLADIDGDGDFDLITPRTYTNSINAYQNIGDASNFILYSDTTIKFPVANWDEEIEVINLLYPVDLDRDGDLDFIANLSIDDGQGNLEDRMKLIRNTGSSSDPVFALEDDLNNPYRDIHAVQPAFGDLDGDGDIDALFCNYYESGGLRYLETRENSMIENTSLIPEFSDGIVLPITMYPPQFVDYDGDGDYDLIHWKYYSDAGDIGYYEYKETGQGLKYVERPDILFAFLEEGAGYQYPLFVDLDLDGDKDIIMLKEDNTDSDGWIYEYLKNSGSDENPVYEAHFISALPETEDLFLPSFVDIDNDGDLDMFLTGKEETELYQYDVVTKFYESTGEDPLEFIERTDADNPLELLKESNFEDISDYARPTFSDIDGDGDFDVLFAGYYGLFYLENIGVATEPAFIDKTSASPFSSISLEESFALSVNLVDFDGDGDDDLFIHELYGLITKYYENTLATGKEMQNVSSPDGISIFPNPASSEINVRLIDLVYGNLQFEIISLEGKTLMNGEFENKVSSEGFEISTSNLASGYYILRLKSDQKVYMSKFVIK